MGGRKKQAGAKKICLMQQVLVRKIIGKVSSSFAFGQCITGQFQLVGDQKNKFIFGHI